jgi:aryl-alcohol dehydrogenase (NADP+)
MELSGQLSIKEKSMQYMKLGNSGLSVSRICLGMMSYGTPDWRDWVLDEEASKPFVQRAIELGINFFDTADIYSLGVSEQVTGKLLKQYAKRDQIVIATKVFFPLRDEPNIGGLSRKHIFQSVEDSLRRLDTDYIDLYQIHRWDYTTPIEETLEALHDLVKSGKVRYIGASSMFAYQMSKSLYLADLKGWTRFISMQNHYNLVYREEEREMNKLCIEEGVGLIPWSPLARGFLAGNRTKDKSGETKRAKSDNFAHDMYFQGADFAVLDRVIESAEKRGVAPAQIALAWLLHKPGVVSPIIGATRLSHLEQAVDSLEIELREQDLQALEELYMPHPVLGHD